MPKEKIEVGVIRPIYTITGFQVCKTPADKPEEADWTPVEKISEAEILSFIYKQQPIIVNNKKKINSKDIDKKIASLHKKVKELEDEEIADEDL